MFLSLKHSISDLRLPLWLGLLPVRASNRAPPDPQPPCMIPSSERMLHTFGVTCSAADCDLPLVPVNLRYATACWDANGIGSICPISPLRPPTRCSHIWMYNRKEWDVNPIHRLMFRWDCFALPLCFETPLLLQLSFTPWNPLYPPFLLAVLKSL